MYITNMEYELIICGNCSENDLDHFNSSGGGGGRGGW
jgi:hypothetical protein